MPDDDSLVGQDPPESDNSLDCYVQVKQLIVHRPQMRLRTEKTCQPAGLPAPGREGHSPPALGSFVERARLLGGAAFGAGIISMLYLPRDRLRHRGCRSVDALC